MKILKRKRVRTMMDMDTIMTDMTMEVMKGIVISNKKISRIVNWLKG